MRKKPTKRRLVVVLDTNMVFSKSVVEFINPAMISLMSRHSSHTSVSVEWIIPDIVRDERREQMLRLAIEIYPSIRKYEQLTGQSILVDHIVENSIDKHISQIVHACGIEVHSTDYTAIDLEHLAKLAIRKVAPFSDDKSEKGFKDALALECLAQIIASKPSTAASCLIQFASDDTLLQQASKERFHDCKNFRQATSLDDIESLINALGSEVTDDFVNNLLQKAGSLLFKKGDSTTLWAKADLGTHIMGLSDSLDYNLPEGATTLRKKGLLIKQRALFVLKAGAQVTLRSVVSRPVEAIEESKSSLDATTETSDSANIFTVATGEETFTITWSVEAKVNGVVMKPELIEVDPKTPIWQPNPLYRSQFERLRSMLELFKPRES